VVELSVIANTTVLTESAAPVFCPTSATYSLIFAPAQPDDGRLCKGVLVVLVGLLYMLPAFEASLSSPTCRLATPGTKQTCSGVSGSLSELLESGISTSEEGNVRGMKKVRDGKKSLIDGRFEKGSIIPCPWATSTLYPA
jgi:hypothetical protein